MFLNHRQYSRCPLPSDQLKAELILGRLQIPCRMTEISVGGFAVIVGEPLPFPALSDRLCRLKFEGLEYIVRVAREECRDDGVVVALEQIEEIVPDNPGERTTVGGRILTWTAWAAAVGLVAVALYCVTGANLGIDLSTVAK